MIGAYFGCGAALLTFAIGQRYGIVWGFLAFLCELAGITLLSLTIDLTRTLKDRR